jgi:hypothetical protein
MDTRGLGIEIGPADDSVLCSSILLAYEKHISRDFRFSSSHNLSPQIMKTDDETSQVLISEFRLRNTGHAETKLFKLEILLSISPSVPSSLSVDISQGHI